MWWPGTSNRGIDVETSTVIARPRTDVAAFAGHPDNVPAWYAAITSVEWRTAPVVAVGSRIAFVASFLGRRLAYTYEIVELIPGERLVMRTAEGPFPMETTYGWEALPDGATRMTLRNRGTPTGFSRWLAPFMASAVRRANRRDLARLKRVLEAD
ncbi:MAG: ATPase [Acidimicrobiia bacterium]|nr:ATPase [Acidimicrobiia bacterium]